MTASIGMDTLAMGMDIRGMAMAPCRFSLALTSMMTTTTTGGGIIAGNADTTRAIGSQPNERFDVPVTKRWSAT
jgi:hypothetical protein